MFKDKKIHMIGIGGISMSGIAEILLEKGIHITGSDMKESKTTLILKNKGINITIGENPEIVKDADIIVHSAAINEENSELKLARELNKEIYERAEFLGLITKEYENVICISGTHGKSTTTGMISSCFLEANLNPTIQIGAFLPLINSNYYVGGKKYFIMESCEYKDQFLSFYPTDAIILNIDNDHLDYFKNIDNIKKSFAKYTLRIPKDGNLIINSDDKNTMDIKKPNISIISFGINNESNLMAKNIKYSDLGYPEFDVYYQDKLFIHIKLGILGKHNIYNALATIAICIIHNLDKEDIIKGLANYKGVERRFEFIGTYKDTIKVYDDYAHHPTEIKSTYSSVKNIKCHKNYAIFQSHTYSRTIEHLEEFADILKNFDNIIIAPIYPAREKNIWGVKEDQLVDLIKKDNPNVCYIDSFDKIVSYLKDKLEDNDLVITIGAGPINEVGLALLNKK